MIFLTHVGVFLIKNKKISISYHRTIVKSQHGQHARWLVCNESVWQAMASRDHVEDKIHSLSQKLTQVSPSPRGLWSQIHIRLACIAFSNFIWWITMLYLVFIYCKHSLFYFGIKKDTRFVFYIFVYTNFILLIVTVTKATLFVYYVPLGIFFFIFIIYTRWRFIVHL